MEDGFINISDSELEAIWRDKNNSKYSKSYIESVHQEILNRNLELSSTQSIPNQMEWTKVFGIGVALWAIYFGCRYWLIHAYPASSWMTYFYQDVVLTGFRLPLFIAILVLVKKTFSAKELGFRKGPLFLPVMVGVLILFIDFIRLFSVDSFHAKPTYYILELGINLLIAASEEISFRGLFYNCLLKIKNKNWAVYGSSFLFILMHVSYQPLAALPSIFVFGLTFAKLRAKGVSLTVLILIHWASDFLVFVYPPTKTNHLSPLLYTLLLLLPLGVAFYWKGNGKVGNLVKAT